MKHTKLIACASAVVLAVAAACSKDPQMPASPSGAEAGASEAGPNGETLKATAATPQSPINNAQLDLLVLTAGKSSGLFDQSLAPTYSYEFQIMNSGGTVVCSATVGGGSGSSVSWTPPSTCSLAFDAPHTWRLRPTYPPRGAVGPWSSTASFRSPAGGYIRAQEIFDPLHNGITVGQAIGTTFIPGTGIRLNDQTSRVTYQLPQTLEAGEFSLMVLAADEGSPGDKTKIMSMQEGGGDITTNDYRMTVEKRGREYENPGAITFRIITGEADEEDFIHDAPRNNGTDFSSSRWYFWKFTWRTGQADLIVREDGPTGRVIYSAGTGTGTHPYRPVPHMLHLGAPVGRAGPIDASVPGAIYKNVWVSANPRPAFPGE